MKKPSSRRDAPAQALAPSALSSVTGGVARAIAAATVDRAGLLDSGPSDANRLLDRHELPGNSGG